ncbi:hypothetical protein [Mycobacterium montefiorense]|uniref:Uncharacterized protein n=1 Tax=Mycobacterium montefiorense TaxID=154654 RepID=A0AA37UUX5_9MYCO|nr:hypothetical protein [Mycobacterium montefiorense]GBG38802.1 hypothetical protein MmonteBS_31740 [Mycobacterium montefiorense]GKU34630.1 hypothetical protein NJB14191_19760 [Mycobacterium montefiorense]GKU38111.1 hypothetical protein NJB14192_01100 [Mycobacterium montefiorense]GKU43399.1 hypothetical protein NJB14194_00320 [Mycobacterium montefiorense]GKU50015.1 hypothetical protein NJB14195_12610 [Mycobacterium montefiorense]
MTSRWVTGDQSGLSFPADPAALREGGAGFLTDAFRASGVLTDGNAVNGISEFAEIRGGSTGRKVMLSVEYDTAAAGLHTELFVKFSRDLDNPIRDRGKTQMEPEVRFASLSRTPGFPIAVPSAFFGDYHQPSETGILITERIKFGDNGIERQYHKCLDYEMPEPLEHYRALVTALARLAGTHRSGRLPAEETAHFPLDVQAATVGERAPLSVDKLERRVNQLAEFTETHPGLLPTNVGSPEFLARLRGDVPRLAHHEHTVTNQLAEDADYVALCHWNANIDNAWFWRDTDDVLHCGLMDWGCVSQMNLGMAIWGAMSGAETELWDVHLDDLLQLFVTEVLRHGGPQLDPFRLRRHTLLYAAAMGVACLLEVPALIRKRFDTIPSTRKDPRIRDDESVRAPLQMLSNLLNLWERYRVGELLDEVLAEGSA